MTLEIWILERDVEQLKRLRTAWLSMKDDPSNAIRYMSSCPKLGDEWICVHISLDDYTILTDHNLLTK
jgi:hypothetical protein